MPISSVLIGGESARTPIVFDGPGVVAGARIEYAETIDVVPTIASIMGIAAPNEDPGSGLVLTSILPGGLALNHPRPLTRINAQIREHAALHAQATLQATSDPTMSVLVMHLKHELLSEHQFFGPDRLMEWHEAGSLDALIEANAWVIGSRHSVLSSTGIARSQDGRRESAVFRR